MTTPRQPVDLDAEREVDLARWRRAVARLWWLPVAGLVIGAVVGVLYSYRGGSNYQARALISLGEPLSPGGSLVPGYSTNPLAISQIVSSPDVQAQAAADSGMRQTAIHGHVAVAQVGASTSTSTRSAPLISLTVNGSNPEKVAAAANALATLAVKRTTAAYVQTKIRTFQRTLGNVNAQIANVNKQLTQLNNAVNAAKKQNINPFEQLVVVSQADNAQARLGNLIQQQETLQQQLAFATQVEAARVVVAARAEAASAHSRSTSAIIGAVIGLVLGAIAAIVAAARRYRLT
jgi:uncharacterized protein involved in exopolysaccharide biosynthesis